ncbi:dehydrogenase/reductase SDR family member on chromosome X isoform X1 [Mugil cephalus]|uniref:dehydrogenase/reductase SDR family member on chromosome X isoform X1 n=1 Tax=Mugil cephalus TaxID=48193 RepID=UPI001FB779DD|nr:dehydrogenase/reductase SDR family member on chromosome X isoform X1 [Mugil cephalus]XP_047433016.1 dehydrogenase/reductase SDR family member on chromosome X isoform X1 [Mugil cephalus]
MEGKNAGPSCSGINLVAHPRAKSKVWKYFGFDTDADGCILHWKRIYCRVCMSQIAYSGNTSNLAYHLEKNHPVEFSEFVKSNTDQMREAFVTAFSRIKNGPTGVHAQQQSQEINLQQNLDYENRRHNDLTIAVINFICEGLYPVSIVEEPTFKTLMSTVDPGYSPPSKSDLAVRIVPQLYSCTRDVIFRGLAGVVNCAVSTDLWQSKTHSSTYISLSVHSVNYNSATGFSMTNKCLKTFEVQEENTTENITRAMYEAFVEWGITHKVSGATTNGSVDIVKACSLLELSVEMPCLGHSINRAMDEAFQLPRLDSFMGRCRKLVDHFRETPMYVLREKQSEHGPTHCALISDRGGSWLATLAMLQRLKEQQVAVTATLRESPSSHHVSFDGSDWAILDGLIEILQSFKAVANMITSCKYPTISMVRPVLHMLLSTTLKAKEGDLKEISMTKEVISKVLSCTYSQNSQVSQEISTFLNIATFLDPRYKKLPFLSTHERSKVESNVIEEAKAVLEKQILERSGTDDMSLVCEEPPSKKQAPLREFSTSTAAEDNPLAAIFCQSEADQSQEELHAQVIEELSNYKSQRVLGLNEDPLIWWSSHASSFPTLPRVLQKYWCVPATSIPSHRLFSSSGTVLCGKRNRIAPALVDQQVFLYENSRGYYEPEPGEGDFDTALEGQL